MNTLSVNSAPLLPQTGMQDYVFVLDDLELAFPKEQLSQITKSWNQGEDLDQIAQECKRQPLEILLALVHQSRKNRIRRPFARVV